MPLPKRQHSKTRGRKRRTHWKVSVASLRACPQCTNLYCLIVSVLSAVITKVLKSSVLRSNNN